MSKPTISAHRCPGGCGQHVPDRLIACRDCWYEVPADLRATFGRTRRGSVERLSAAGEIFRWYLRQNTEDTPLGGAS